MYRHSSDHTVSYIDAMSIYSNPRLSQNPQPHSIYLCYYFFHDLSACQLSQTFFVVALLPCPTDSLPLYIILQLDFLLSIIGCSIATIHLHRCGMYTRIWAYYKRHYVLSTLRIYVPPVTIHTFCLCVPVMNFHILYLL